MEIHILLLQIATILIAARIFAEIATHLMMPPIIGELFAGILLGLSLLGWISASEPIKLLAEIGIILLLFEAGLKSDIDRLFRAGPKAITVALGGFITPFLLGLGVSYLGFGLPLLVSLFIGGTLTATSIGITVRILKDAGRHKSYEGQIVLGAAVIDDLLGIFLLSVLFEFTNSGTFNLVNTGKILIYVAGFFFLAPIFAKLISPVIKRIHRKSQIPGAIPTILISMVLIFAGLAHLMGAPHLLGGFVTGIALSRRFFLPFGAALRIEPNFNRQIQNEMRPIIQMFTPIFFVTVGLTLDLGLVDWASSFIWYFSLSLLVIAIVGKLAGPWLLNETIPMRTAIGMAMVPRGEVGLVFAELGRLSGVLQTEVYAAVRLYHAGITDLDQAVLSKIRKSVEWQPLNQR